MRPESAILTVTFAHEKAKSEEYRDDFFRLVNRFIIEPDIIANLEGGDGYFGMAEAEEYFLKHLVRLERNEPHPVFYIAEIPEAHRVTISRFVIAPDLEYN